MAADYTVKQNDTARKIEGGLKDASDADVDLTGASVVFSMWRKSTRTLKVNRATATIVGTATNGDVEYQWLAADVDESGGFEGEFEVTFADATIQTFPNDRHIQIAVVDDIA